MKTTKPHIGSTLDTFLEEDGTLAEVRAIALKRVLTWQLSQAMETKGLSKDIMANAMNTNLTTLGNKGFE